jgi:hypothetical protein
VTALARTPSGVVAFAGEHFDDEGRPDVWIWTAGE